MYNLTSKLIVYRNLDKILLNISNVFKNFDQIDDEIKNNLILDEIYHIIELSSLLKFKNNFWTTYICYILATSENPFTLSIERSDDVNDVLKKFALNDFDIFIKIINYDFTNKLSENVLSCFDNIKNATFNANDGLTVNIDTNEIKLTHNFSNKINELYSLIENVKDVNIFYDRVVSFYKKYGVGSFGLYKAFRVSSINNNKTNSLMFNQNNSFNYKNSETSNFIVPIEQTSTISFSNLIGYEEQKKQLIQNTDSFVNKKPANNVLLYGDPGTGKSSSIKSVLNMYYDKGLRMIEVYKQDFKYLPEILSIIKNRNYRFIIYFDDLSFENNETEYKYLKAVIEGGLEEKPENVLVYATSNRVHLLHETFSDRKKVLDDDVHINDTLSEQTSLADRFGLSIGYFTVKRQEFFDMVLDLASKNIELKSFDKNTIIKEATLWNMYHTDYSGRSAKQFIAYLLSQKNIYN